MARARAQLLSGDPAQLQAYLERVRRDKRFDGIVKKAIKAGQPLSKADADRIAARYSDRLLKLRAETISRNESIAALHAGQYEGLQQLVESGKVRADQITLTWSATPDSRTRDTHMAMNGQTVRWGQPFTSPAGAMLLHPHDASMGAPASEIIQCRCTMLPRIKYL